MLRIVTQRTHADCGICAIASLTGERYEDVYLAADGKGGLSNRDVFLVAEKLGCLLAPMRRYDLDCHEGVLRLRSQTHRYGHFVAVRYGLIVDGADGTARPWRQYQRRYRATFGTFLRRLC